MSSDDVTNAISLMSIVWFTAVVMNVICVLDSLLASRAKKYSTFFY